MSQKTRRSAKARTVHHALTRAQVEGARARAHASLIEALSAGEQREADKLLDLMHLFDARETHEWRKVVKAQNERLTCERDRRAHWNNRIQYHINAVRALQARNRLFYDDFKALFKGRLPPGTSDTEYENAMRALRDEWNRRAFIRFLALEAAEEGGAPLS